MKAIIALAISGLMLLLPVAAFAQTGPNYVQYANQSLINSVDNLAMLGNLTKALFSGTYGESNAAFIGQWQANSTMGGNSSTVGNAQYLGAMYSDSQAQTDLNYGFEALGQNASQIQCGALVGPSNVTGAITTGTGDCKTKSGTQGMSYVSALKASDLKSSSTGGVDVRTNGARALASLIRGGLSAFVLIQKGTVGAINPF